MISGKKRVAFFTALAAVEVALYIAFRNAYPPGQRFHLAAQIARIGVYVATLYVAWPAVRRSGVIGYSAIMFGCMLLIPALMFAGKHYDETRTPTQPRKIIQVDDTGVALMDYRIGAPFEVPQCPTKVVEDHHVEYDTQTSLACFRHIDSSMIGKPVRNSETLLVDRLDVGRHYANLNWIRPVCIAVDGGRIAAVAVHIDVSRVKAIPDVTAEVVAALHANPHVANWTRTNHVEVSSFAARIWKAPNAVFGIFTEQQRSTNVRGGVSRSSVIVVATPDMVHRFTGNEMSLGGDCPTTEFPGSVG